MTNGPRISHDKKYFAAEDILHIVIQPPPESESVEISPNITAEPNAEAICPSI
jgi:hypothetical protein